MTTTATTKKPLAAYDFDVCVSVRIRLTPEQKQLIKDAYNKKFYDEQPSTNAPRGNITVQTQWNAPNLTRAMGADRFTLASLLATTERYPVAQLQKWERALDITLVEKKPLEDAWKSYIKHIGV